MTLQVVRLLLYLECGLLLLAGIFAVALGVLLGAGNSIGLAGAQVSGAGAVALGVFYAALGGGAFYVGTEVGRLAGWSRTGAIALQALLIVLFLARGDFSASLVISLAPCVAIIALLLTASANAALAKPASNDPTALSPKARSAAAEAPSPTGRR